ncbi:hypothetical protein GQ651_07965 [Alphaproteobacteria bacterium GH1-50]|uniref:Uncharacterized protein n=1 Tax=Kangsaoukella pontilimi TaxID=2691042 RepID=A0A7C9MVN0_9RHOB|nr:hypothetical protein [Kangsaoukella pontilimi]MXQ07780.1 hypothetical protein [Kangsaoukella pontilimi]
MNDVSMSQGLGNRPVERPQMGKSAEAVGQRAKAAVETARAAGTDLPKNAQGVAASGLARGATAESLFAALVSEPGDGGGAVPPGGEGSDVVADDGATPAPATEEGDVAGGGDPLPDGGDVATGDGAVDDGGSVPADDGGDETVVTVTSDLPPVGIDAEAIGEGDDPYEAI